MELNVFLVSLLQHKIVGQTLSTLDALGFIDPIFRTMKEEYRLAVGVALGGTCLDEDKMLEGSDETCWLLSA